MGINFEDGYGTRDGHVTKKVSSGTLSPNTSAYTAGDCLVGGYLTFSGMAHKEGWGGIIRNVIITENGNGNPADTPAGTLLLFDRAPSSSQTINEPISIAAADLAYYVGEITTTAGTARATNFSLKDHSCNPPIAYTTYGGSDTAAGDTALYGIFLVSGTPTFNSGSAIIIYLVAELD